MIEDEVRIKCKDTNKHHSTKTQIKKVGSAESLLNSPVRAPKSAKTSGPGGTCVAQAIAVNKSGLKVNRVHASGGPLDGVNRPLHSRQNLGRRCLTAKVAAPGQ